MPRKAASAPKEMGWPSDGDLALTLGFKNVAMMNEYIKEMQDVIGRITDVLVANYPTFETSIKSRAVYGAILAMYSAAMKDKDHLCRTLDPTGRSDCIKAKEAWQDGIGFVVWAMLQVHMLIRKRNTKLDSRMNKLLISNVIGFILMCISKGVVEDGELSRQELDRNKTSLKGKTKDWVDELYSVMYTHNVDVAQSLDTNWIANPDTLFGTMLRMVASIARVRDDSIRHADDILNDDLHGHILTEILMIDRSPGAGYHEDNLPDTEKNLDKHSRLLSSLSAIYDVTKKHGDADIRNAAKLESILDNVGAAQGVKFKQCGKYLDLVLDQTLDSQYRLQYAAPGFEPHWWQLTGAATAVKAFLDRNTGNRTRGFMLADQTGLGKTFTLAMAISKIARLSYHATLVIVPFHSLIYPTVDALRKVDEGLDVMIYHSKFVGKIKRVSISGSELVPGRGCVENMQIIVTTIDTWQTRHHGDADGENWPGRFSLIVADEATMFKNTENKRTPLVASMKPEFFLLATATPLSRTIHDILGYATLLNDSDREALYREYNANRVCEPLDLFGPDCPKRLLPLRLHPAILTVVVKSKEITYVSRAFHMFALRRGYETRHELSPRPDAVIGDLIPKVVRKRVHVSYHGKFDAMYKREHRSLSKKLWMPSKTNPNRMIPNAGIVRQLLVASMSPVLHFAVDYFTKERIPSVIRDEGFLKKVLVNAARAADARPVYNPTGRNIDDGDGDTEMTDAEDEDEDDNNTERADDESTWMADLEDINDLGSDQLGTVIMRWSPKLEAFFRIITAEVAIKGNKVIVAFQSPSTQLFVYKFLKLYTSRVCMYSSVNRADDNTDLMRRFNDDASTEFMIFLCTFSHGMVGVNLHESCGMVIAFDSPNTMAQEIQAIGRVRRLGQKLKVVQFIELHTDGTIQKDVHGRRTISDYDIIRSGLIQEEEVVKGTRVDSDGDADSDVEDEDTPVEYYLGWKRPDGSICVGQKPPPGVAELTIEELLRACVKDAVIVSRIDPKTGLMEE